MPPEAPKKTNVCAVIVTYHPDDGLAERVAEVVSQVDRAVLVDNASEPNALSRGRSHQAISVIDNKANIGIAAALNQGVRWAKEQGYQWVLTLDQDTVLAQGVVDTFAGVYEAASATRKVGIIGANYVDKVTGATLVPEESPDDKPFADVVTAITSGTLLSVEAFDEIGPFREEFFIDHVDDEYCLRARQMGYDVILTRRPLMNHTSGSPRYHHFLGKRLITPHLPASRRYYRTRNQVVLTREYWHRERAWVKLAFSVRWREVVLVWLFEKDKLAKTSKTIRGIFDGLRRKMGPLR